MMYLCHLALNGFRIRLFSNTNEWINWILRDWSLITGRGGLQNGKIAGPKLFAPPPQERVKLFAPPPFKE